jgi:hypothetical protein
MVVAAWRSASPPVLSSSSFAPVSAALVELCAAWEGAEGLPDSRRLEALEKAIAGASGGAGIISARAPRAAAAPRHPHSRLPAPVFARFGDWPKCLSYCYAAVPVATRLHGPASAELADCLVNLAGAASNCEPPEWRAVVFAAESALPLLARVRGESHYLPGNKDPGKYGPIDALNQLAAAHAALEDAPAAVAAASRQLRLLEALYGAGAADAGALCAPGLESMLRATALNGKGDLTHALVWAGKVAAARARANGGSPAHREVAALYEQVAFYFLFDGPTHSVRTAERLAKRERRRAPPPPRGSARPPSPQSARWPSRPPPSSPAQAPPSCARRRRRRRAWPKTTR